MIDNNMNLCSIIISEMEKLNFKESSVNIIKEHKQFKDAFNKENSLQRTMLTMMFYGILVDSGHIVPSQIRLALNIAADINGWLDDIRLVILPFMKENEDKFFFSVNR